MANKTSEKRKIDFVLDQYNDDHQNSFNKAVQYICVPLLAFGLFGLVWSVPFPHLDFLGKYNGFINWASFLIAFSIYYYYKLSPVLSYGILLIVFAFSAAIVALEKLHINSNWPPMGQVCMGIFVLGLILQIWGFKSESKAPSVSNQFSALLNGPLWLMATLFKSLKIPV
jgi:uncharacterized membrane protein YGL010W